MHQAVSPVDASAEGLVEQAQDATAPQGLLFHHANEGRPLATPWQIAALRAQALMQIDLPDGFILDCACGSGIQLAAYAATLQRPVLGVELAPERAQASAVNVRSVASHTRGASEAWFLKSRIVCGDGTDPKGVLSALGEDASNVAFLHLDPARPRNSRTHALEEMQPPLHRVLGQWAPYFEEPALLLDLSPRLTESQRDEVEALVDAVWPGIARTWEWTSRGRGRVDRLALWLGKVADPSAARRFVRVPASLADRPVVLSIANDPPTIEPKHRSPQRGEHVSILDAALMESGLMLSWLASVAPDDDGRWAFVEGRRPQLHHDRPLRLNSSDSALVQATGKVVDLLNYRPDESTVDRLVETALEHRLGSVKLRYDLDPSLQPKLQGSLDRQLRRRHGDREGFLAQHPHGDVLMLCVCPGSAEETGPI